MLRIISICSTLLFAIYPARDVLCATTELTMLSRTAVKNMSVTLNKSHKQWIIKKPVLTVAVWGLSQPPIFMNLDRTVFEGISADYLTLIRDALKVRMVIKHFDNRHSAMNALRNNEVDLLAFYFPVPDESSSILPTSAWLLDHPVALIRKDVPKDIIYKNNVRMAYVGPDSAIQLVKLAFPHTLMTDYTRYSLATAAVSYSQEDYFWLNSASANYMLRDGYGNTLNSLSLKGTADLNLSFAVHESNPTLQKILNEVLKSVPLSTRTRIATNWGLDFSYVSKENPLTLTSEEVAWIKENPVLQVFTSGAFAPFSFVDSSNQRAGLSDSLLNKIAELMQISLNYRSFTDIELMKSTLKNTPNGLNSALISSTQSDEGLIFSRAYATAPWVVIIEKRHSTLPYLERLMKGKIAVSVNNDIVAELREKYPRLEFIQTLDTATAMEMLIHQQIEAVIAPKPSADYLLRNFYQNKLKVVQVLPLSPARIAMAVPATNPVLLSILNKALIAVSPVTIQHDIDRWQNLDGPLQASPWRDYRDYIIDTVIVASVIVFFFLLRNRYLQKIIIQRKKYESELENQLEFSRTLINKSPVALYVRDVDLRMLNCNDTYLQFLGLSEEEVMGKTFCESEILHADFQRKISLSHLNVIGSGLPVFSTEAIKINGETCHLYHWTMPYHDHQGNIRGIIGGFLDITDRHRLLEELQLAKETADRANKSKSVFLAQMSHEIRTPLNALIGLLELEHRKLTPSYLRDENITVAYKAAKSLLSLVGDILDLAKIESGSKTLRFEPMSLTEVIQSASTLFAHAAMEKQLQLTTTLELTHPLVRFEPIMLGQIVSNLVSNAIKYTHSGYVEIALYQGVTQADGWGDYALEVCDSGIGLSAQDQNRIFEPFVQVDGVIQPVKSTGLGLNICQQLAQNLGGELTVESSPGTGSTFIFRFKAQICESIEIFEERDNVLPECLCNSILIVDDNPANRLLLSQQLEYAGHNVVAVENGEQALLSWDREQPRFDVVITDCNMPGMNGFTLISKLRHREKQEGLSPRPMFGLTAMSEQEVTLRAEQSGMTRCLFKPIELDSLLKQIRCAHSQPEHADDPLENLSYLSLTAKSDFISSFIHTNNGDLVALENAIANDDYNKIQQLSHRMCGTFALIKADDLLALFRQLEYAARSHNKNEVQELIVKCKESLSNVQQRMSNCIIRNEIDTSLNHS